MEHEKITKNFEAEIEDSDKNDMSQDEIAYEEGDDVESMVKPCVKYDIDSTSAVTYTTDTTSMMEQLNPPSCVSSIASSKLELQLNFLAKQLEVERQRRMKL